MKMNHLINGWECRLMVSRGTVSRPIICQKCFGVVSKGNRGEKLPAKILECLPQTSTFISLI